MLSTGSSWKSLHVIVLFFIFFNWHYFWQCKTWVNSETSKGMASSNENLIWQFLQPVKDTIKMLPGEKAFYKLTCLKQEGCNGSFGWRMISLLKGILFLNTQILIKYKLCVDLIYCSEYWIYRETETVHDPPTCSSVEMMGVGQYHSPNSFLPR